MKLLKDQKNNFIFDIVKKENPSWNKDLHKKIEKFVKVYKKQLRKEAEYDGDDRLCQEEFLYERFKLNVEHDMYNGNWQILKYFYRNLRLKVFYQMIGENRYTEEDVEMYNYFTSIEVNEKCKCRPKLLKLSSGSELNSPGMLESDNRWYVDYTIYVKTPSTDGNGYSVIYLNFSDFFEDSFSIIEDMVRNCEMKPKIFPNDNLFTYEPKLGCRRLENYPGMSTIEEISTKKIENCVSLSVDNKFMDLLERELKKSDEFNMLTKRVSEICRPIVSKLISDKKDLFERCSPNLKYEVKTRFKL